ncbi:hypothetical protein Q0590_13245 [Rhodocytophaga aerolata]|uniref:Four helix bundle protein n=1 Tax=Rhodocytophaga aerolata TaxID=455078 RepID=A0ABT8R5M0_9BACT|nr:hypothetical protein [Rhodocytophaga aerolata]MDO1447229.1 hypothetical protein [Rhodocytophaga aerolata]
MSRETYKNLPVFIKAKEISEITRTIVETIDSEKDLFKLKEFMLNNAYVLGAKIAAAEGGDLYSIRMENAVLIKIAAKELLTQTTMCKHEKLCNQEYLQLLKNEIENFRHLYLAWIRTFDKSKDMEDGWS